MKKSLFAAALLSLALAACGGADKAADTAASIALEAAEAAVSAALSAPPQAAKAKDNKAAANRDFFILYYLLLNRFKI